MDQPETQQRTPAAISILLLTAVAVLVADQLSKAAVIATIPVGSRIDVIGEVVALWHVQNTGAAFSLLPGQTWFFYLVTAVALVMIAYFHRAFHGRSLWLQVILGMALGGSVGNLVDRVRLGAVTDFVSVGVGNLRWPTFNVADSGVVIGIGALVAYLILADRRRPVTES